jgi:hypothetical protein
MVFVNVYIHFRIWSRIRLPRVMDPDPAKVPDPCGYRAVSTTLLTEIYIEAFTSRVLDSDIIRIRILNFLLVSNLQSDYLTLRISLMAA